MDKAKPRSEPDAADRDFFRKLRRELGHEISSYVYEVPEGAIGTPLSPDYIHSDLQKMRLCLVDPRWEEVDIRDSRGGLMLDAGRKQMCVTMAEDEGYVLVFDPIDEQYHLAWRSEEYGLSTWGICGDGVGCFIAR